MQISIRNEKIVRCMVAATTTDRLEIKAIFKEALVEVLQERSDLLYDGLSDVLEDRAMAEAIREGADGELVGRDEIMGVLDGTA
jgi:hypothetical protein